MKHTTPHSVILSTSIFVLPAFLICTAIADTHYVDINNPSPAAPYTSWALAANNIQDAVDQADAGDTVLVADGQYILASEIIVSEDISLRSLNGPSQTCLDGGQSVRCVNLGGTESTLEGFKITQGNASEGGGIYCSSIVPSISNCWLIANMATTSGGGAYMGTLRECLISSNTAARVGGGACSSALYDCEVTGNRVTYFLGKGGGLYSCDANQSLIIDNYSARDGGGIYGGSARHCVVTDNSCGNTGNGGAGMHEGKAFNSIVYYNSPGLNFKSTAFLYSCAQGISSSANGNISNDPAFVDRANNNFRLQATSPCINAGLADVAFWAEDYYGNPRVQGGLLDMGLYESDVIAPDPICVSSVIGDDSNDGASWDYPKRTIQAAIVAQRHVGGTILIGDGTYLLSSEIKPNKDLVFKSLNGPESAIIDGQDSVRCFNFSGTDSWAIGLTVQRGDISSPNSGGSCVHGGSISNCIVREGSGFYDGMIYKVTAHDSVIEDSHDIGAKDCKLYGCIVRGNYDEAVYVSTANNCTVSNNLSSGIVGGTATNCLLIWNSGRGAVNALLYDCLVSKNHGGVSGGRAVNCQILDNSVASGHGGGMSGGSMSNCVVRGNLTSGNGGGVYGVVADQCVISENSATEGGGAYNGILRGCAIFDNMAGRYGGGTSQSDLIHCTVVGNHAEWNGGGANNGAVSNSIVYYNTSYMGQSDIQSASVYSSCSPDVFHGADGNITNQPMLISSSHIAQTSPCRGTVSSEGIVCPDIDGEPWGIPSSMGCDEFDVNSEHRGSIQLALSGPIQVVAGYACRYEIAAEGNIINRVIDFGDGTDSEFGTLLSKAWADPGEYFMTVKVYNDDFPIGISTNLMVQVLSREQATIYVKGEGGNDANDGSSWETAKATIQSGVDAQNVEGGLVVLASGSHTLSSEVLIDKNVQITGESSSAEAIVDGDGSSRCFNLGTSFSILDGLWITNGYSSAGGGIYCENVNPTITNCVVAGNYSSGSGGGVNRGTLTHCVISNNLANSYGGGVSGGLIKHSLIKANQANQGGGGTSRCTIFNSEILGNTGALSGGVEGGISHNCIIRGNSALSSSSGIGGGARSAILYNCLVIGNTTLYGGGIRSGTAINCIAINNQGSSTQSNYNYVNASHCCGPDLTHGVDGNITNAPVFIDESNEDYHLTSGSPGIDSGMADRLTGSKDMDGRPRIMGTHIDMGPYEWSKDILQLNIDGNQVLLSWIPVSGTRVYDVLWSPDLRTAEFVEIQTGIAYPKNSFSDDLDIRGHQGFYKLILRNRE